MTEPALASYMTTKTSGNFWNRLFAFGISWCTAEKINGKWVKSPVNHAAGYIGDGNVIEASRKVQISPISKYPSALWATLPAELTPTPEQQAKIVEFWKSKIDCKYNWLDIIAIGLAQKRFGKHLKSLSKKWWVKRLSSDSHYICSQLLDAGYDFAGIHLFTDGRPEGLVSPEDLRELDVNAGK